MSTEIMIGQTLNPEQRTENPEPYPPLPLSKKSYLCRKSVTGRIILVLFYNTKIMKEKSIGLLNKAVADELTAVHQYMYFHFHCDDQGFDLLANLFKRTAIEEMLHVERLAERILFLKGDVKMDVSGPNTYITDVKEMLTLAREMEESSARDYNIWANECAQNADSVSKKLFEALVEDEERHFAQYDIEMENLEKFGDKYLALQSIERSRNSSMGAAGAD